MSERARIKLPLWPAGASFWSVPVMVVSPYFIEVGVILKMGAGSARDTRYLKPAKVIEEARRRIIINDQRVLRVFRFIILL